MNSKKIIALLLSVMMIISVTVGCSSAEWGYFNLSKEVGQLERYAVSGEIGVNVDYIGQDYEEVKSILNAYSLSYDMKVDVNASLIDATFYLNDKVNGGKNPILTLKSNGDRVYMKINDMINFAKSFGDTELNAELDAIFGDTQYFSFNREEMNEILTEAYGDAALADQVTSAYFDFDSYVEESKVWQDIVAGAMDEVYDDYEMGIIKEDSNNKYTLSVTPEGALAVFVSFANYSIDNIEELGAYMKGSVNMLNDNQKKMITSYGISVDEFNSGIDEMIADVSANKDMYKSEINNMLDSINNEEMKAMMGDTKIDYTYEKTADNEYKGNFNALVDINDAYNNEKIIKGTLYFTENISAIDSFSIETPTENIISMSEFMAIMDEYYGYSNDDYSNDDYLDPTRVAIDLDTGYCVSDFSEEVVDVIVINGSSYLPFKAVGTLLGIEGQWDNSKKQPFVEMNGEAIYLNAKIFDGSSYVQMRELEKLAYTVDWDSESNIVSIY